MDNNKQVKYSRADSSGVSTLLSLRQDPHEIIAAALGDEGGRFRDYRQKWERAIGFEYVPEYPLHVDLELVFDCNLHCPMCIHSLPEKDFKSWGVRGTKMDFETACRIVDEGVAGGMFALGLNGINEPLLVEWLPELVYYARKAGIVDIMFNTNGMLMTPDVSRKLVKAGLTRIMISLDAVNPETYRRIRNGGDFSLVKENLEALLAVRAEVGSSLPVIRCSFVRMSINEHELDEFIRQWGERVDFLSIQQFGNPFEGTLHKSREKLRAKGVDFRYEKGFHCPQPWARALVRADGSVLPCCDWHGIKLPMGNIHKSSLQEIWNSQAWQKLRELHREGRYMDCVVCHECALSLVTDEACISGE